MRQSVFVSVVGLGIYAVVGATAGYRDAHTSVLVGLLGRLF